MVTLGALVGALLVTACRSEASVEAKDASAPLIFDSSSTRAEAQVDAGSDTGADARSDAGEDAA